jgi:hypothetical protein
MSILAVATAGRSAFQWQAHTPLAVDLAVDLGVDGGSPASPCGGYCGCWPRNCESSASTRVGHDCIQDSRLSVVLASRGRRCRVRVH